MSIALGGALALAGASALALNWGYYAQHEQASRLPPLRVRHPLSSLYSLFSNRRWLSGFFVGIGGWVLYVGALALGPLSLVQATSAGGIGILALLVRRLGKLELSQREWAGVALSVLGLALLGISLAGQHHHGAGGRGSAIAIGAWMASAALAAAVFAGPLAPRLAGGAGLGVAAGLCYAAGDVGTKAAVGGGARFLFVPAILAAHGLGFVLLQLGFQRGAALATAGVATLLTNAVPIAAGMIVFGDGLPGGALGATRLLAFVCVVFGAALLAHGDSTPQLVAPAPVSAP
ncbi:MAG TPA: hypothetical protein VF002_01385 [Gaiellaceae bacterium]